MPLSERDFQTQVVELARITGWQTMHVRRTIGKGNKWVTGTSVPGWPDLAIWGHGRFILAELKTDRGTLTAEQEKLVASLRAAGVDVRIWRPHMWDDDIQPTLPAHIAGPS